MRTSTLTILSFIFISSHGWAVDSSLKSPHFLSEDGAAESEISCEKTSATSGNCKLIISVVNRLERTPGGVCPYEKVSQTKMINVSLEVESSEAHGDFVSDSGQKEHLSFNFDQQKITGLNYQGSISKTKGNFVFKSTGRKDPCEEFSKELMSSALNHLPLSTPNNLKKENSTQSPALFDPGKRQSPPSEPSLNSKDPNLGHQ